MTSGSSAYSSRSESSAFSPFGAGSVTELSDVGSSDTFLEYDHHPHRCTSEGKGVELVKGVTHPRHPSEGKGVALTEDVTPDMVPKTTKAWNRVSYYSFSGGSVCKELFENSPTDVGCHLSSRDSNTAII